MMVMLFLIMHIMFLGTSRHKFQRFDFEGKSHYTSPLSYQNIKHEEKYKKYI